MKHHTTMLNSCRAQGPKLGLLLGALALPVVVGSGSAVAAPPSIFVAYPEAEGTSVAFDHVLFEGSVTPGSTLSVSGRAIPVGPDGLFIEWLPLRPGANRLVLQAARGAERAERILTITSRPAQALPASPTVIVPGSVSPNANLKIFDAGSAGLGGWRVLTVSFEGSPGGSASFKVAGRGPFPMPERRPQDFPGSSQVLAGRYEGVLALSASDRFEDAPITVSLRGVDGQEAVAVAGGRLSAEALAQPRVGIVTAEPLGNGVNSTLTSARNGPGRNSILWLKAGMKFVILGEEASTYRVQIAPGQSLNVLKDQLRLLPLGTPLAPRYFSRIEARRVAGGTQVRFALPDRVAYSIQQSAAPGAQSLDVRLYNTESDVDYMVSDFPDALVRDIRWAQESDGVFLAHIDLGSEQQWGHQTFYEGNTLVLQIKDAPAINRARPLLGRRIVVDAGHGGVESGAPGGLGVPEKDLVLLIAMRLASGLRARGAEVILTRASDVRVPLAERPLLAEKSRAEILISIHANALPDGVDPGTQRGTAVYYYQPQARSLADALLSSLVRGVPGVGSDGIHYQNLALTRPTSQLSVLVETAFMTDKANLRLLMSPAGRESLAQSLAQGLEDFYSLNAPAHQ